MIDGLKLLLKDTGWLQVSAEANDALTMFLHLKNQPVDVLLTDITMPGQLNGYELCVLMKKELPTVKIITLSMNEDGYIIEKMKDEAGVNGFISKAAGKDELVKAIQEVVDGRYYFSESVLQQYERYVLLKKKNDELNLTVREKEILACIVKHYSNKQIATELFISERTVETHRKNIYRKTNTKGEASLIRFVQENKIL